MALIDCIECGSTVSDSAGSCPHCGHPVQSAEPARGSKLSELDIWFNDDGRIGPGQYWARYLTLVVIGVLLGIVGVAYEIRVGTLAGVLTLLSVYPSVALAIKRLHDRNMSGWVFLVSLVPLIGTVAWIVISVRRGTSGPNRYGPRTGYQWGEKDYQGEHSQLSSQIARTTRDESAIREFSSQRDWLVRKAVAENPHTPPGTLGRLASDSVPGVRAASARNPSLPSSILNRLAGDAEPVVSRAASETLSELAAEEMPSRLIRQTRSDTRRTLRP